jgi:hypothetical protein
MSPGKRGDRVAPPAEPGHWVLRFGSTEAAKGWEELCRQAPGNTRRAWEEIGANPKPFPSSERHHQLKGKELSAVNGLEQWQYEVTGGGRKEERDQAVGREAMASISTRMLPRWAPAVRRAG